MLKHIIPLFLIFPLFLSACSDTSLSELIYHDREKFTFEKDKSETSVYLCKQSETIEGTKKRAASAHQLFSTEFDKLISKYVDGTVGDMKSSESEEPSFASMFSGAMAVQNEIEELVLTVDKKYDCLFVDSIEHDEG